MSDAGLQTIKTPSVRSVDRSLSILETLVTTRSGLTMPDLALRLKLPKSSIHCLLVTLERRGYLHRNEKTNRYLFGLKLFSLANESLSCIDLRFKSMPYLRGLMNRTRLTVHLALLERNEAVLIQKVEPLGTHKLATWIGKRMDLHCTGVGKAMMACLPEAQVDRIIREHGLPRHNDNTIVTVPKLTAELARIRRRGYSVDDEEDEVGYRCVGAPIFDAQDQVVAAVSVSATTAEITSDDVQSIAQEVKQCAASISGTCCN